MKKQNKTFASKAKSLINKYKRANFDPIEKKELEAALEQLSQEQEAYKQTKGIDQEQSTQQFATGGNTNWWEPAGTIQSPMLGGQSYDKSVQNIGQVDVTAQAANYVPQNMGKYAVSSNQPSYELAGQGGNNIPGFSTYQPVNYGSGDYGNTNINSEFNIETPQTLDQAGVTNAIAGQGAGAGFDAYKTSIGPQMISAGIGMAGDLYLNNRAKKFADKNQISPNTVQANLINLSNARESVRRESTMASSMAKRNLRNTASRGEFLSGVAASTTGLTKNKNQALSDLYNKEAVYNQQSANQASNINSQLRTQADMTNLQTRKQGEADQQAYISSAFGQIPKMTADINASRQRDAMINAIGEEYGYTGSSRKGYKKTMKSKKTKYKKGGKL